MNPLPIPVGLDAVLTTDELVRRPARSPDHAAEARALADLARTLAERPRDLLQRLAELAQELCGAGSAGISILEEENGEAVFRWHAIAGAFSHFRLGTIARDTSPCGVVIARDTVHLFSYPERHFPYPVAVDPPIAETLLIPFHAGGKPVGTVWVVAHTPDHRFDPEDARLLASLSEFAAAAWQTVTALDAARASKTELERRVETRTKEVRAGEEKYRLLFDSIDEGFCVIDVLFDGERPMDYRFVEVNASFENQTGLHDAAGRRMREFAPAHESHWFDIYGRVAKSGEPVRFENWAEELGRWFDVYAFKVDHGHHDRVGVLFHDITEQRRIAGQLREHEEMLREAAEMAHVGGWSFDPATGQSEWTEQTYRIHNLDPATPAEPVEQGLARFPGEDRRRIEEAVRAAVDHGAGYDLELDFKAAGGANKRVRTICRPVMENGKVVRVRGSFQDVTARHMLEKQFLQSQKMDAFGQLAGGVAHDFNNMLQVINGYADLAINQLADGDPLAGLLDEIRTAGERSAALTRQLLAFARQQVASPRVTDLSATAADTSGMLRRLIGEDVRLVTDLPPGVWPVFADPGNLEQVLLNFAVNARDAMPAGGILTVATRNETVTVESADAMPGDYAVLAVTDTGTGMPPEVQARIFEPFFTTKGVGKGTGLGLATVYGIVRQAGGHLRVKSKEGEGSTFEVCLPRTEQAGTGDIGKPGARMLARGKETVLVVEDEAAVRGLVKKVLTGCGYTVLDAVDGAAAERLSAEHGGPIHLILSDVVMPGGGGRAVVAGVLVRHPEAKVVYMSGYTDDAVVRQGISAVEVPFLQKPFTPAVLAAKVRKALDAP